MAQSITLMGATYPDVPSILLPKSTSGMAQFDDTTIASNAASAADIASGKLAWVNGSLLTGTASGGGGTSPWHKLVNAQENVVSTTSTTATSAFTIELGSSAYNKNQIIWVHIRDKAGKRAGYFYGSDAFFINYYAADNLSTAVTTPAVLCIRYTTQSFLGASAGQYGVYGYGLNSAGTLTVRKRYNSSSSLTINGTFVTNVYALDLPDSLTLF